MRFLNALRRNANQTVTENGAVTLRSTGSDCLDLFATVGALRGRSEQEIADRFLRAYAEDPDIAMKILFYARDIRGGLGERRVFRVIAEWLAENERASVIRNLPLIPEYGRWDDLLVFLGTSCEKEAVEVIRAQLEKDVAVLEQKEAGSVSLLAKWLPSVNASNAETVQKAKRIAKALGLSEAEYRKTLSRLRAEIRILENSLREMDYSFDYEKQPSRAMFKYRKAFIRNDGERYQDFLDLVSCGKAELKTGGLMPYEIIAPIFRGRSLSAADAAAMDTTWNALPDYTDDQNTLAVIDGSGSMYCGSNAVRPIEVAMSLGIYFAERNRGEFRNCFITFSNNPKLVEIKGRTIAEKVRYCKAFNEVASTDVEKVFRLILSTALKERLPQKELPSVLYIITDMEFNCCARNASLTNFENAKQMFEAAGYRLPKVVFWNVDSRNIQQPVRANEAGVALVSGCTPRLFSMAMKGDIDPYKMMMDVIRSERYAAVAA